MKYKHAMRCLVASVLMVSLVGCSGETGPKTYPVTGTVMQKGKPVEGAVVAFTPEGEGLPASGTTDASGVYTLTTKVSGDGAVAGNYKVTIAKYNSPTGGDDAPEAPAAEPADPYDITNEYPEGYDEQAASQAASVASKNLLPEKYAKASSSGLTAEVTETGENKFDFTVD